MKKANARNAALALTGLLALSLYILACTSFSPDDSKVLYPAFSGNNGAIGLASYDRETARSELIFLPADLTEAETNAISPALLRGQWLANGRQILATWMGKEKDDVLNLTLLPFGGRGPVQHFTLPLKEAQNAVLLAPPVVGHYAFVMDDRNDAVRLDLANGQIKRHPLSQDNTECILYPSATGRKVFYLSDPNGGDEHVFGRLDPETLAPTPLLTFTNALDNGLSFTYDLAGERIAFVSKAGGQSSLVVLERGKPAFTQPLPESGQRFSLGNGIFSRNGQTLIAGFARQPAGTAGVTLGLIEIPLRGGPPRETVLLHGLELDSQGEDLMFYFQIALSHDGKTAAVASTYIACLSEKFNPGDCALFFVDLSDAKRKVTKVPIPLPARRGVPVK